MISRKSNLAAPAAAPSPKVPHTDGYCDACGQPVSGGSIIRTASITIDQTKTEAVHWKGHFIHFTAQEQKVLAYLVSRGAKVTPKWAILETCFSDSVEQKIVDVIICRLRTKIRSVDPTAKPISTVWGRGYAWSDETKETLS